MYIIPFSLLALFNFLIYKKIRRASQIRTSVTRYKLRLTDIKSRTDLILDVEEPGSGARAGHDALLCGGGLLLLQPAGPGGQYTGGQSLQTREISE